MKKLKRILGLILIIALSFSLFVSAFAKTSSEAIDSPAGETPVFTVKIGTRTISYSWSDITGNGSISPSTGLYGAKVEGVQTTKEWTGVLLSDILSDIESKFAVTLDDDYRITAISADNFPVLFTVGDVRNPENRYMVASDPVKNYDDDIYFENSYVRILRGEEDTTSNFANIRCIVGIEISDAVGGDIAVSVKPEGGDIRKSVFYIAVQPDETSDVKYYYYTMEELEAYSDTNDYHYMDYGTGKTVTVRGASLKSMLSDISGVSITDDMIIQYAEADGYHADRSTDIDASSYKDKVSWLTSEHEGSDGTVFPAVETYISYETMTAFDEPSETNVNSTYWEDADGGSGYLRAYRQRENSNSGAMKSLMGVVVSYNGQLFTGEDGYTVKALSETGAPMDIIDEGTGKVSKEQTITGLVPGMMYAVKAPSVNNASVVNGQFDYKIITALEGSDLTLTFNYTEKTYLNLITDEADTKYRYTEFRALSGVTQTPAADEVTAHGTPYGYFNEMFYRYNGIWLSDLIGTTKDVIITSADGSASIIDSADVGKYFVAYGHTASKSDSNSSENKRNTFAYESPVIIIPGDGTLVGTEEAANGNNKMVTVAFDSAAVITVGDMQFSDLAGFEWAAPAINSLSASGVVNGVGGSLYSPAEQIKRGDFILMLYRAYNLDAEVSGNFSDVPSGSYYFDAIATLKALGIAKGDGVNFNPEDAITRQEAMTLIYRTLVILGVDLDSYSGSLDSFADASSIADWAQSPIKALVGAGIINGSDGNILPEGSMTRAQMAVALYRALKNIA